VPATPLVRRIAGELGVDIATVAGTGPGGRITEEDVRGRAVAVPAPEGRRIPVRGVRRRIVEHLTTAHREIPAVTFVEECDFTGVDTRRIVPLALRAVAESLKEFPELNARLEGDEIVLLDRYDIGLAVQTDDGLVVPVVRGCDTASEDELAEQATRLADGARAGTLGPEELRGSTFTITSAGRLGGLFVTPLINHPEVGILGIHRIAPRPVVVDAEVAVREIGNVSVTFDHRVVDGARAAAFCLDVIARLQAR
jgi:pyruvate dehydrogenase E2 component (dihydrolipoamide acetyltransferase)